MAHQRSSRNHHHWYTCFDPVGSVGNVHFLIINKTEYVAGGGAQAIAKALKQQSVTLKRIQSK